MMQSIKIENNQLNSFPHIMSTEIARLYMFQLLMDFLRVHTSNAVQDLSCYSMIWNKYLNNVIIFHLFCIVNPNRGMTCYEFESLSMTGPRREKFFCLQGHMAAPFGDMMLTGCFGLVDAVKLNKVF